MAGKKNAMSHAERLKELLERRIVTGDLKSGEKLEELEIAARYEVSRTPVREALVMLEAINLVERRPRQGAVVKGVTFTRLIQMLEVLAELDAFSGRLAAKRIKEKERKELQAALAACVEAEGADADDYYNANVCFHKAVYAATYNSVLIEQTLDAGERMEPFFRTQHHQPGWIEKSVREHTVICEAIIDGRGEEAAGLLRKPYDLNELFAAVKALSGGSAVRDRSAV